LGFRVGKQDSATGCFGSTVSTSVLDPDGLSCRRKTIELLSGRGKFSMEQSLILAEAMDLVIDKTQFVTVPILDARLAMVNARIDVVEAKLGARIDKLDAKLDARIDSLETKLDAKFERWTVRIIIAMVLTQTAAGPIGMRVFDSMKQVIATLGH
jgi:hypothetical protein